MTILLLDLAPAADETVVPSDSAAQELAYAVTVQPISLLTGAGDHQVFCKAY